MGVTVHYEMNTSICGTKERPPAQPCQQVFEEAANAADAVMARTGIPYRIRQYDQRDLDENQEPFYGIIVEIDELTQDEDRGYDLDFGWRWDHNGYDVLSGPNGDLSIWRPRPKVWYGGRSCKTAGAQDWTLLHLSVVTILETWKEWALISSITDEARWHPGHDPAAFAEERAVNEDEVRKCLDKLGLNPCFPRP